MYLALARKYRPQTFGKLIGQPHITRTLQNAIKMNRLYPSLIFSGMKGVGKTSTARILAKALNCEKGPAVEPCNRCDICREITEDRSPDYLEIDGASNNGVEEVRSLREKIRYKPFKNRFRIVVIDEVHMLSNSAWNALLKTIEEPPEHTYFILATTDFRKIPSTIVSRSQHYEFRQIPGDVIIKVLQEIAGKEKIKISDYGLFLIAHAAEGSLRDAKKILDQAIALSSGDIDDGSLTDLLGIIEEDVFIALTESLFRRDRKGIIRLIAEIVERGIDLRFFYGEFLQFLRELMVIKMLGEKNKLHRLNPSNMQRIGAMIREVTETELLRYFNAAKDLEGDFRNTQNPRILLEYLCLKLSFFPALRSIEEVLKDLGRRPIPSSGSGRNRPVAPPASSDEERPVSSSSEGTETRFREYLEAQGILETGVRKGMAISVEGDCLVIRLTGNHPALEKWLTGHRTGLEEKVRGFSDGRITGLKVVGGRATGSGREAKDLDKIKKFAQEINLELIDIKDVKGGGNAENT